MLKCLWFRSDGFVVCQSVFRRCSRLSVSMGQLGDQSQRGGSLSAIIASYLMLELELEHVPGPVPVLVLWAGRLGIWSNPQ